MARPHEKASLRVEHIENTREVVALLMIAVVIGGGGVWWPWLDSDTKLFCMSSWARCVDRPALLSPPAHPLLTGCFFQSRSPREKSWGWICRRVCSRGLTGTAMLAQWAHKAWGSFPIQRDPGPRPWTPANRGGWAAWILQKRKEKCSLSN